MIQSNINQVISLAGMLGRGVRTEAERTERIQAKAESTDKKAQEALKREQERKRKTRRNFSDYVMDRKLNIEGWTVKDLPKAQQQEYLKTFSKYQRKKIMDEIDAERMAKKK